MHGPALASLILYWVPIFERGYSLPQPLNFDPKRGSQQGLTRGAKLSTELGCCIFEAADCDDFRFEESVVGPSLLPTADRSGAAFTICCCVDNPYAITCDYP